MDKNKVLKEFRSIPGVGKSISEDLWNMGYRSLNDLKDENPEDMYKRLCLLYQTKIDRCMLYVFRCAVYFVTEKSILRKSFTGGTGKIHHNYTYTIHTNRATFVV